MAVDDVRSRPAAPSAPKAEPKKVDTKPADPAPSKPKNEVKPQAPQAKDGYDGGPKADRAAQQRQLGSATAPSGSGAPVLADKLQTGLGKLGLTQDDLMKAAEAAKPDLVKAANAAADGDTHQAISSLKDAAVHGGQVLAEKAIPNVAKGLPDTGALGAAKAVLTDPKMVHELVNNEDFHGALEKLGQGDLAGGLHELAANKPLRDAALDLVAKAPGVQAGLSKLGFNADDLKRAGDAAPNLIDAAVSASKGDFRGAIDNLKGAGPVVQDLATKGILNAAKNLPDTGAGGVAKSLLSDEKFVRQMVSDPKLGDALGQLAHGNVADGLKSITGDKSLRDAAVDALAKNKDIAAGMAKLGLTPDDLKAAGTGLPSIVDAGQKIAGGDVQGALKSLQDAASAAAPVVEKGIIAAAKNLPDSGAGGMAKSLLTDKTFVKQLVENEDLHGALGQFASGDVAGGLKSLASNQATRDAAIDALAKNKDVAAGMAKLGLNADDFKQAGEALPALVDAGTAAARGDYQAAFKSLQDATQTAAPTVEKAIGNVAKNLPEGGAGGLARSLLTDPGFVKQLVENKDLHGAIGQIASGKISDGLKALAGNGPAADAAIDALAKNKDVAAGMAKLNLTADDLKASKGALPQLVQAGIDASKGDFGATFKDLQAAAGEAAPVVEKGIIAAAKNLPDTGAGGVAKSLLTDPAFVKQLVENKDLHGTIGQLANGNVGEGLKALVGNGPAADAAIDALAKNKDVAAGMAKLNLTADDLKASKGALPQMVQAGIDASKGDFGATFQDLQAAAGEAAPVVEKSIIAAAKNLPDTGAGGIAKSVLTDPAAVKALVEDKDLRASIGKLATGDLSALKDIAKNPGAGAIADAVLNNPDVKAGLDKIGLTPADVKGSLPSLADVAMAAKSMAQGDFQGAFQHIQDAGKDLPPSLVEKAITATASKLPDSGPAGMVKSLLTDKGFVQQLVENKDLHAAFDKMISGNFEDGLKDILGNAQFRDAAASALANNPEFMKKLAPFGIATAKDLAGVGTGLVDLMKAGEAVAKGDLGGALKQLGTAFKDIPADTRGKMIGALADKLGLPAWAKDTLTAVGGAIGDPAVGKALGDAISAFKNGDVGGFARNLTDVGKQLAHNDPAAATALLDSLSHLPGSLGKLFSDRDLNKALVDSGSVEHMFNAVEKLIGGDPGAALSELGNAVGAMLGQGDHFSVAGHELPFGMDGIKNVTRLFGRFIDALPDSLKHKIEEAAAKFGAKTFLKSIPGLGNIVNGFDAIGSAKDLINDLRKDNKDWLQVSIDAAQTGLDIAGVVPGLNDITGPLQAVLGTVKVVKGATDLIGDVREFQKGLLGM